MQILPKLLRFFLTTVLIVVSMFNITTVKAMKSRPRYEDKVLALKNYEISSEMLCKSCALVSLEDKGFLCVHTRNRILINLFLLPIIADLSRYLAANKHDPKAVIYQINQLFTDFGYCISVSMLRTSLSNSNMHIGDINLFSGQQNCLNCYDHSPLNADCIKIVLSLADDDAWRLISTRDSTGWDAWHNALYQNREEIIDTFINWAMANNKTNDLLNLRTRDRNQTGLHQAANLGIAKIFKALLEFCEKHEPGLAVKMLMLKDRCNKTVLDYANDLADREASGFLNIKTLRSNAQEIGEIIKSYIEK